VSAAELPLIVLGVADSRVKRERAISQLLKRRRNVRRGHLIVFYAFSCGQSGMAAVGYNGYQ
jgi:hypothetical protein